MDTTNICNTGAQALQALSESVYEMYAGESSPACLLDRIGIASDIERSARSFGASDAEIEDAKSSGAHRYELYVMNRFGLSA